MSNFKVADFVNTLNIASRLHLDSVHVENTKLNRQLLVILYKNGIIYNFVYDKITNNFRVFLNI